jgi:hypothetical protein
MGVNIKSDNGNKVLNTLHSVKAQHVIVRFTVFGFFVKSK